MAVLLLCFPEQLDDCWVQRFERQAQAPLSLFLSFSPSLFLSDARILPLHPPVFTFAQCLYLLLLYKNCGRTCGGYCRKHWMLSLLLTFSKNPFAHMFVFSSSGLVCWLYNYSTHPVWQLTLQFFFFNFYRKNLFLYFPFMCLCLCVRTLSASKVRVWMEVIPTSTAVFFPETSLKFEFRQLQIAPNQSCLNSKVCVCLKFVCWKVPWLIKMFEFIHISKGFKTCL